MKNRAILCYRRESGSQNLAKSVCGGGSGRWAAPLPLLRTRSARDNKLNALRPGKDVWGDAVMDLRDAWNKPGLEMTVKAMMQICGNSQLQQIQWRDKSITVLQDVLGALCREYDPWFYDTTIAIILFGCRISELPTLQIYESGGCVQWSVYCSKQECYREGKIYGEDVSPLIQYMMQRGQMIFLDRKAYSYRMGRLLSGLNKYMPTDIKHAAHFFRHLWVTVINQACGVPIVKIQQNLRHEFLTTTSAYILRLGE